MLIILIMQMYLLVSLATGLFIFHISLCFTGFFVFLYLYVCGCSCMCFWWVVYLFKCLFLNTHHVKKKWFYVFLFETLKMELQMTNRDLCVNNIS